MKKLIKLFRNTSVLMLVGISVMANDWIEKKKSISFAYNNLSALNIDNQFGDVKVNYWDRTDVKIEIVITANATSEERANSFIRSVDIAETKEEGTTYIKTNIDKSEAGYRSNITKNGEKNILRIDYQVFIPKAVLLNIKNSFGNTYLPSVSSRLRIDQNYGNLYAENIKNSLAEVDVSFGKAILKNMEGGKLKVSYSTLTADKLDDLLFDNSFGKVDIKELGKVDAKISYSNGNIQMLTGSTTMDLKFSNGLNFGTVASTVKDLGIKANYSHVKFTLDTGSTYEFDVKASYGHCDLPNTKAISFSRNSETEEKEDRKEGRYGFSPTKYYAGKIGKGQPTSRISVNSSFSNIKFQ